ncbi:unnamed protein product [Effrenium voratum]|nr:unnamed protein product [Effrenium voratum]
MAIQARNPVPPMIEKIAQPGQLSPTSALNAMLHEGQQRADAYLGDLSKSNALVSAMRQRTGAEHGPLQPHPDVRVLQVSGADAVPRENPPRGNSGSPDCGGGRYVMNMVEGDRIYDLHLDGLSFGMREIKEMLGLFQRYECFDQVYVLSLIDNGLDDVLNCFSNEGIKRIEEQLRDMDGVTGVIKSVDGVLPPSSRSRLARTLNVHSGNQLRLALHVGEQLEKTQLAKDVDFTVDSSLSHAEADPFLETAAARSEHPWTQTAQRPPQKAVPDVSSVPLEKPSAAPAVPAVGGPPVGLGGPGNLAALNKKLTKSKTGASLPDPFKKKGTKGKANQRWFDACVVPAKIMDIPLTRYNPNDQTVQAQAERAAVQQGQDGTPRQKPALADCPALDDAIEAQPRPFMLLEALRRLDAVLLLGPRQVSRHLLELVSEIPFTAILTEGWNPDFQDFFPHCVGKNFGGFATVLSKPRVDKPPGYSRPVLRCVLARRPLLVFLRDLFQSKTVLLCGCHLPLQGLLGRALKDAWASTRARDVRRFEPLAYALGHVAPLEEYGLQTIPNDADPSDLGFFRALAADCAT